MKEKKKISGKWYAGAPERGGDSAHKMTVYFGNGAKPTAGKRRTYGVTQGWHDALLKTRGIEVCWRYEPYFSFDWKNRWKSKSPFDPLLGIKKLKDHFDYMKSHFDVTYATIEKSNWKGAVVEYWSLNTDWVDAASWTKKNSPKEKRAKGMYRAWVCFTPEGKWHRRQAKEKYENGVEWSQEHLTDSTNKLQAVQTLVNGMKKYQQWIGWLQYIWVYEEKTNKKVGRIEWRPVVKEWKFYSNNADWELDGLIANQEWMDGILDSLNV